MTETDRRARIRVLCHQHDDFIYDSGHRLTTTEPLLTLLLRFGSGVDRVTRVIWGEDTNEFGLGFFRVWHDFILMRKGYWLSWAGKIINLGRRHSDFGICSIKVNWVYERFLLHWFVFKINLLNNTVTLLFF